MKSTRCKMRLEGVYANAWGGAKAIFRCEYDQQLCVEDRTFAKATPNGMAEFQIDNASVTDMLVIGKHYYFDISPVPEVSSQHGHEARVALAPGTITTTTAATTP